MPRITDGKPKASSHFIERADMFSRACDVADALSSDPSESRHSAVFVQMSLWPRVSDLLCMSKLAHASATQEHENDDDFQGTFRRAAERR
jgi:hypothetical protein